MSLAEAFDCLDQTHHDHAVIPGGHEKVLGQTAAGLLDVCEAHDIATLAQALKHSSELIAEAAMVDIGKITQFQNEQSANRIHLARNTLAAALAASALVHGVDPTAVLEDLAGVCVRGPKARSLKDDEILLLRLLIVRDLHVGGRRNISGVRYLLADAGLHPSETTVVTPASFEVSDPDHTGWQPTNVVYAPGVNKRVLARMITLDRFAQRCLHPILAQHTSRHRHSGMTPIGYTGTHPCGGSFASASASGAIKKLMQRACLDSNLEPLGIVQWRVEHTLTRNGINAALAISGKTNDAALSKLLKQYIDDEEDDDEVGDGTY